MSGIKVRVKGNLATMARFHGEATQETLADVGRLWHHEMLPPHFTTEGGRRYNYAKRSEKYMIRKAKQHGHQRPLVFSGYTEKSAKAIRDIRATRQRVKVTLHTRALNFLAKRGMGRDEVIAVDPRDATTLQRAYDRDYTRRMRQAASGRPTMRGN
jgi:hypothetical protein